MTGCQDWKGNKLRKGFYKDSVHTTCLYFVGQGQYPILYFTGRYNKAGLPLFKNEYRKMKNSASPYSKNLSLIRIPKKEIKEMIDQSEEKINWLEKRLEE